MTSAGETYAGILLYTLCWRFMTRSVLPPMRWKGKIGVKAGETPGGDQNDSRGPSLSYLVSIVDTVKLAAKGVQKNLIAVGFAHEKLELAAKDGIRLGGREREKG
jgi:hypothetical protein